MLTVNSVNIARSHRWAMAHSGSYCGIQQNYTTVEHICRYPPLITTVCLQGPRGHHGALLRVELLRPQLERSAGRPGCPQGLDAGEVASPASPLR